MLLSAQARTASGAKAEPWQAAVVAAAVRTASDEITAENRERNPPRPPAEPRQSKPLPTASNQDPQPPPSSSPVPAAAPPPVASPVPGAATAAKSKSIAPLGSVAAAYLSANSSPECSPHRAVAA